MSTSIIIFLVILGGLYFFYRYKKAQKNEVKIEAVEIDKVKAEFYIVCPKCGAHLEVEKDA